VSKAEKTSCPSYLKNNGAGFCQIYQEPCPFCGTLYNGKCMSPGKKSYGTYEIKRILEIGSPEKYEQEKKCKESEKLYKENFDSSE